MAVSHLPSCVVRNQPFRFSRPQFPHLCSENLRDPVRESLRPCKGATSGGSFRNSGRMSVPVQAAPQPLRTAVLLDTLSPKGNTAPAPWKARGRLTWPPANMCVMVSSARGAGCGAQRVCREEGQGGAEWRPQFPHLQRPDEVIFGPRPPRDPSLATSSRREGNQDEVSPSGPGPSEGHTGSQSSAAHSVQVPEEGVRTAKIP